jgi:hypothetical protein
MSGGELGELSKSSAVSSPFSAPSGASKKETTAASGGGGLKQWSFPRGWKLKVQAEDLIPHPYRQNCIKLRTNHISVYENVSDGSVEFTFTEESKVGDDASPARGGGTYVITKNMMKRFMNAKNAKIAEEFNAFVSLHTNAESKNKRKEIQPRQATGSPQKSVSCAPTKDDRSTEGREEGQPKAAVIKPPDKKRVKVDEGGKRDVDIDVVEIKKEGAGKKKPEQPPARDDGKQKQRPQVEPARKDAVPFPLMVVVENHADMVKMAPTDADRQFLRTMASNPLSNTFYYMTGAEVRVELNKQFSEQKMASRSVIPRIGASGGIPGATIFV